MAQPVVLFSTCNDSGKAQQIASQLVEQRIAACVNIVSNISSTYRWEGKIETASELLMIIKTQRDQIPSVRQVLQELSGYQLPELIAMDIIDGSPSYLDWLIAESKPLPEPTPQE